MIESHFINGQWRKSDGVDAIAVFDSTDGSTMATISSGAVSDVDAAVESARAAFPEWSATPPDERADICEAIGDGLTERAEEICELVTREAGTPTAVSRVVQTQLPINSFRTAAATAREYEFDQQHANSLITREPVGVVGCITPWNYPLNQISAKVAYALAAGCSVVLKPSEVAPLDAAVLAEVIADTQLPAGAFNIVFGSGPVVGEAIAAHADVDMVSFTGSTRAGKQVAATAAATVKRVTLELGGKSANVLLDDLLDEELEAAVRDGIAKCYLNSGQTCVALTRMLVPRQRLKTVEAIAADEVEQNYRPGDPFERGVRLGPLASRAQVQRVNDLVRVGAEEGATLVVGGPDRPEGVHPDGFFVQPSVFSDVDNVMAIAQQEIFGPVLSIIPFDDENDAVRIANDSPYGLAGGVHSQDKERAVAVARRIRTGQVQVNRGQFNPNAPFGGYKQSGYGREHGEWGFEEFLEVKAIQM